MKILPRRLLLVVASTVIALLSAGVASASATTLYVDNGNPNCTNKGSGTATQPFCSIGAAASVVTAGQTVEVEAGTYPERVSLSRSGTSTAPIIFKAADGAMVTVTGGTNGFYTNGKAYVTIEGFTVTGTSQDAIVVSTNSSFITVQGNHVTYSGRPVSGATARGIRVDVSHDDVIANNIVDHNTDYGIYVVGGSTHIQVTGNRVFHNFRVFQRAASGIRIHDSEFNTISGNITYDNEDSGIELVTKSHDNLVVNNVIYGNGDHGIDDTGNGTVGSGSPNNTFIGNAVYQSATAGIDLEGGATNCTVMNNIAVDNGINSLRTHGNIRVYSDSIAGTTLDYNIVYLTVPGQVEYNWNNMNYATLAQFRADPRNSGQEVHTLETDPKWNSPIDHDFTLKSGSPAIDSANSGVAGASATDAIGTPRIDDPLTANTGVGPRTYDDRGPFEYTPQNQPPVAALTVTPSSGPFNLDVTADASGSTDNDGLSPIASYTFDWGDGSPVTGPQTVPTAPHTYTRPGTYTVRVTVTDTANLSSVAQFTVTVRDDPPVPALTVTPGSGPAPLDVTADASASTDGDASPIASYTFDWGDGPDAQHPDLTGPQASPQATHTYATAQAQPYTVTVTVTDTAGNSSTTTADVTAFGDNVPPTAALSVSPSSGNVNLDVTADASASTDPEHDIANYKFDWGDGSSTGEQPAATATHTFTNAGSYVVKVTVTDGGGEFSTKSQTVTVTDPPPVAKLTVSPSSGLAPVDVTADASASTDSDGTPIATYKFDWGDDSSTGDQPGATATHTYGVAGSFTVKVTVTDTAGQATTATSQIAAQPNLVGNPGFETSLMTGWNTSGSVSGVTLTQANVSHSGAASAKLATGSTSGTCTLNDAPNWVGATSAGKYNASLWVRGDTPGATLKLKLTEWKSSTNVGSAIASLTLTTSWQKVSVNYTPIAPGSSTLDFNAYITGVPASTTCFYADDAAIWLT